MHIRTWKPNQEVTTNIVPDITQAGQDVQVPARTRMTRNEMHLHLAYELEPGRRLAVGSVAGYDHGALLPDPTGPRRPGPRRPLVPVQ